VGTFSKAGGTHHAFADRGEGFCVFNDIAVAARAAMKEEGVERVLVIDLDVHQVAAPCLSYSSSPGCTASLHLHHHGDGVLSSAGKHCSLYVSDQSGAAQARK
jgi:hypothetical protein